MAIEKLWPRLKKINYDQAEKAAAECEQQRLDLMEKPSPEFFFLRSEADTPFCLIIHLPMMPVCSKWENRITSPSLKLLCRVVSSSGGATDVNMPVVNERQSINFN